MNPATPFTRPSLETALDAWKRLLADRGFSSELLWIFEENICFEKAPAAQGGFHPGFQIKFAPPSEESLDIAYDHFCESGTRIVLYRLGENRGRSVCILLGDPWFEDKGEGEGYLHRDEWRLSFFPGRRTEIEEVTDLSRWLRRIKRERPLHDVDFCMTLAAIDEIRTHGRVLAPYERFADALVGRLRRIFSHAN